MDIDIKSSHSPRRISYNGDFLFLCFCYSAYSFKKTIVTHCSFAHDFSPLSFKKGSKSESIDIRASKSDIQPSIILTALG